MIHFLSNAEAEAVLAAGGVMVVPTDTVWGIGLDPFSGESPEVLADLKGRRVGERAKPIAWLIHERDDLTRYGRDVSALTERLADEYWPGPLTLVVNASCEVPAAFQSESGTIGLRWAAYWPTQILLERIGHPLAVTSANRAGEAPPQRLTAIDAYLLEQTAGIVGPPANEQFVASGVASTVLDCTGPTPRLLRNGEVSWAALAELIASGEREGETS